MTRQEIERCFEEALEQLKVPDHYRHMAHALGAAVNYTKRGGLREMFKYAIRMKVEIRAAELDS